MDRRLLPAFVMLSSGTIACIICVMNKFSTLKSLFILLVTLIVFYLLGLTAKIVMDSASALKPSDEEMRKVIDKIEEELQENEEEEIEEEEQAEAVNA